jgi:hypothetical protein
MKTTIKLLSALVLSVGFVACGGEPLSEGQTVDENGNVVEATQALSDPNAYCQVTGATSNTQTGLCYQNNQAWSSPIYCKQGLAYGTPVLKGTYGGLPNYVNQRICH